MSREADLFFFLLLTEAAIAICVLLWWLDRSRLTKDNERLADELEVTRRHLLNAQDVLRNNRLDDPGPSGDWKYGVNFDRLTRDRSDQEQSSGN